MGSIITKINESIEDGLYADYFKPKPRKEPLPQFEDDEPRLDRAAAPEPKAKNREGRLLFH